MKNTNSQVQGVEFVSAKKLSCTNCGGTLEVRNKRAQYISCLYCGAVLDLNSQTYQIIQQLQDPKEFRPYSFIRLGTELKLFGVNYIVIGRTRWQSIFKEYYEEIDEEGEIESGYTYETWEYDEWLLYSEYKNYLFLIEDREGFAISASIIPTKPNLPQKFEFQKISFFERTRGQIVQEYGKNVILYFEGESTYLKKLGEPAFFAMYRKSLPTKSSIAGLENIPLDEFAGEMVDYIVEWRVDEQNKPKEIEFFCEIPLSRTLVYTSVKNKEEFKIEEFNKKEAKVLFRWCFFLGILTIGFGFLVLHSLQKTPRTVANLNFSAAALSTPADTLPKPVLSVQLEPGNFYELQLKAEYHSKDEKDSYSSSFWENEDTATEISSEVNLIILDEHNRIINHYSCSFWHVKGFECDEEGCLSFEDTNYTCKHQFKVEAPILIKIAALQVHKDTNGNYGNYFSYQLLILDDFITPTLFVIGFFISAIPFLFIYFYLKERWNVRLKDIFLYS